jgi:hypothetical protein
VLYPENQCTGKGPIITYARHTCTMMWKYNKYEYIDYKYINPQFIDTNISGPS